MKLSICIVTYRRNEQLIDSLTHLLRARCSEMEILIADNGASDQLPQLLQREFPNERFAVVVPNGNPGCAALNQLFAEARGEVIVALDDDSYPAEDGLRRISAAFAADPQLGMVGCKLHDPETGEAWHDPWWNPDSSAPQETVFCPGCGMAFRNDSRLPKSALCLPEIVSQGHELSITAEIIRLGYKVQFRPECIAYHVNTRNAYQGEKARIGNQNQAKFLLSYADPANLMLLLLSYLWLGFRGNWSELFFGISYLRRSRRVPLSRIEMLRFRDVLTWHIHPRLHRFLGRAGSSGVS